MSFDHLLSVMNLLKQHPNHMMPQKILKSLQKWRIGRVRKMWGFLTFFVPLGIFLYFFIPSFSDIIWPPSKCNGHIETTYKSYDAPKNFENSNQVENLGGYEQCEDSSHSSYPWEFFSIFSFRFFRISFDHLLSVTDLFKQHTSHMMPQKILKSPKKWRIGGVRRMWGFLTFFVPLGIF